MPLRRLAATLALLGMVALAGCDDAPAAPAAPAADPGVGSSNSSAPAPEPEYPSYVALGDSYTAAPGVPETDLTTGCARSDGNYPSLLAAELGTELTDVSCSGASTLSLVGAQPTNGGALPAQFDALTADTSLVTLGIGGNDEQLFQTLVGTCAQLGADQPRGAPCRDRMAPDGAGTDVLLDKVATIRTRVTSALKGIHDRSPAAEVVLVGYPQPVPARGTCPILPLAGGDYPYVRSVVVALNDALATAAKRGGATFIDLLGPSKGHDICAGPDAWVNGLDTDLARALAFHPFAAEQQAVADLVVERLGGAS